MYHGDGSRPPFYSPRQVFGVPLHRPPAFRPLLNAPPRWGSPYHQAVPPHHNTPFFQPAAPSSLSQLKLVEDSFENRFKSWLVRNEHVLVERQKRRVASAPKLPIIRSDLAAWFNLLQQVDKDYSMLDSSLKEKLLQFEQELADRDTLNRLQIKLREIRKKRRYQKRCRTRNRLSSANHSVVCRTSVFSVLARLRLAEESCESRLIGEVNREKYSLQCNSEGFSLSDIERTQQQNTPDVADRLVAVRQATVQLNERLLLLDACDQLRSARLAQARQQGGLFPEALDFAFTAQMGELRTTLKSQLAELDKLQAELKSRLIPSRKSANISGGSKLSAPEQACCDHFPELANWEKQLLFGTESNHQCVPWRWRRFYHQADFDFTDFIRIRSAWDSYLVPKAGSTECNDVTAEPSSISITWILPPEEPSAAGWSSWLAKSTD